MELQEREGLPLLAPQGSKQLVMEEECFSQQREVSRMPEQEDETDGTHHPFIGRSILLVCPLSFEFVLK